jgi:hypothetical protein
VGRARLRHHRHPRLACCPVRLVAARRHLERRRRKPAAVGASVDALHTDGRVESNRLSDWDRQSLGLTLEQRDQGIANPVRRCLAERLAFCDGGQQRLGDALPINQPVGKRLGKPER